MKLGSIAKSTGKAETKVSINVLASNAFTEFSKQEEDEEEVTEEQDQTGDKQQQKQQQEKDNNEEDKPEEDLRMRHHPNLDK